MNANVLAGPVAGSLSPIAKAIAALYDAGKSLNDFVNAHIEEMKQSAQLTIARTGRVLEAAKYGFGIGFVVPVAIIAAGQLLLGNPLAAAWTLGTALTNPIAMTCAAVGAIYFGWNALSDAERNEALEKLSKGLDIGIELVKSIVGYVIAKTKELLSSENLKEVKQFISKAAASFGKTLGDVTRKVTDVAGDALSTVRKKSGEIAGAAAELASDAYVSAKESAGKAAGLASEAVDGVKSGAGKISDSVFKKSKQEPERKWRKGAMAQKKLPGRPLRGRGSSE